MSSLERKKEEEKQLIININNYSKLSSKVLLRFSLAFPATNNNTQLISDIEKIRQREGLSFNALGLKALYEYRRNHNLPNPQAQLDRMLTTEMPHKPSWQCCVDNCRRKAKFTLILKDYKGKTELFPVCKEHKQWRHRTFKFLKGVKTK